MTTQLAFNWWEIKNGDWSFTQPLKMAPLGERISVVLGTEQDNTPVVKNPQLQRLQMLLDSPKSPRSATDLLMGKVTSPRAAPPTSPPAQPPAQPQTQPQSKPRREPPKRV